MKKIHSLSILLRLTLVFILACSVLNCTTEKFKESTDETLNITEFLKANPEYSSFLEIMEITDYASFMNTYGTYTLFLPDNDAVAALLSDLGVSSISDIPLDELQDLTKLHILEQTIKTTEFTDGKIAAPSLQGQFLITGASNKNGTSSITVNKTSSIISSNIEVGNGVIHVIDKVLRVADKTLAQTLSSDTSLSLFTEAVKATGWYDKLNLPVTYDADSIPSYLTVIAQSNEVFQKFGLNTLEELKTKYSHLGDPTNPQDSLNLFVAYRIIPGLNYLADLADTPAVLTKAPLEVITVNLALDTLLLNEETFNGVLEKGVEIDRITSDITASNGALHLVNENFFIKKRLPAPVYFDVADQPEFRQLSSVFRTPGAPSVYLKNEELSLVSWPDSQSLGYVASAIGSSSQLDRAWHGDVIDLNRFRQGHLNPMTFTTPVIIKGQYKVWVSYRTNERSSAAAQISVDGVALPRLINFREYGNTDLPERVLESQGYKRHIEPSTNRFNCRLVGIINIETTGTHQVTLEAIQDSSNGNTWIDVIEFRPIDMDQLYPKFEAGGDGLIFE
ncbi:fasciclin domain-containing protein [Leeuwenhoekiella sp. LLG6367-2.1]|uniref:fasciclin domain-containing protein n=1 Tax=Leeuwenhoekiella sp. LLG6367-2.1 TaxID=3160833 RepID=UPI0038644542